jgi:hypothetical protein
VAQPATLYWHAASGGLTFRRRAGSSSRFRRQADPGDAARARWGDVEQVVSRAAGQADQATRAAGKQLTVTAAVVREKAGDSGRFATVGRQVASGLEQGGSYLEQQGAGGAAGAVGRRWWALLALLGIGLAAIALSRRRGGSASADAEPEAASA